MDDLTDDKADPDYVPDEEDISTYRNYSYYPQTIEFAMRYGLSDNVISGFHNSIMVDRAVSDPSQLLSPEKVRKMKQKHQFHLMDQHKKNTGYKVLGVDGKKSDVKVARNQKEKIDKQTVIDQVEKKFVGHFTPSNGEGPTLAHGLFDVSVITKTQCIF